MCLEGRSLGWGIISWSNNGKKNRSFFWNLRVSLHSSMRCNLQGTAHRWSAALPPVSNILYLLPSCWCTSRSPTCHKMDLLRFHPPKFNHSHRSTSLWDTSFKTDKTGRSEDHWKRPVLNSVLLLAAPSHQSLANRELKKMLSPSLSLWKQSTFQHRNCIFQFFRFSNHENTWGKSCHLSPPSFPLDFLYFSPWAHGSWCTKVPFGIVVDCNRLIGERRQEATNGMICGHFFTQCCDKEIGCLQVGAVPQCSNKLPKWIASSPRSQGPNIKYILYI